MKIGIISDSHDDVDNVNKAITIFEEEKVRAIIHAGDIISPPIVKEFKKLTDNGIEFFGIFGNNDGEQKGLENAFAYINGKLLGNEGKIEILSGLNRGDIIVAEGLKKVYPRAKINPIKEGEENSQSNWKKKEDKN